MVCLDVLGGLRHDGILPVVHGFVGAPGFSQEQILAAEKQKVACLYPNGDDACNYIVFLGGMQGNTAPGACGSAQVVVCGCVATYPEGSISPKTT